MRKIILGLVLVFGFGASANADIWRWVDDNGNTHFVDTMRPIYTWKDESGKVFFADKPGHSNAVSVQLIWHSSGSLTDLNEEKVAKNDRSQLLPGETEAERDQRVQAEDYYCKRATEIYDSYVNAPRLYKTGSDGEPEYLSDKEAAATIAETKAQVDQVCS